MTRSSGGREAYSHRLRSLMGCVSSTYVHAQKSHPSPPSTQKSTLFLTMRDPPLLLTTPVHYPISYNSYLWYDDNLATKQNESVSLTTNMNLRSPCCPTENLDTASCLSIPRRAMLRPPL
jgi:hypothetical protein